MKRAVDAMVETWSFSYHQGGDEQNTMAIGWGHRLLLGGKPVFTVVVRNSRHTFN